MQRPAVTTILPFHGSVDEAREALDRLDRLELRSGDAVLLVDNTEDGVALRQPRAGTIAVVDCPVKRSAYAARNVGAELAASDWLLFVDADCRLPADLIDRYFEPPPAEAAGAVAGQVVGTPDQPGVVPRWVRSRHHLDQEVLQDYYHRPMVVTANLLVRKAAWEVVGGFAERTRSGADNDFAWRLLDAGWTIEYRANAQVMHDHRATLPALLAQARRDGAGGRWLARRHPGYPARMGARAYARALAGAAVWPVLGQPRRGLHKALDGIWSAANDLGTLESNAPPEPPRPPAKLLVLLEEFPTPGDPLVAAIAGAANDGSPICVEARRRPTVADWTSGRAVPVRLWEDDAPLARLAAAARLGPRRGLRSPQELGPPALRLRAAAPEARVLVEPGLMEVARLLSRLAGRADLRLEPMGDRAAAAATIGSDARRG
jgi:GT2 family glycosyltransferase